MSDTWNLRDDLIRRAGVSGINLTGALVTLGMLTTAETTDSITLDEFDRTWVRLGSETYCYIFSIGSSKKTQKKFILKACTVFTGQPINEIFSEWLRRRDILSRIGVSTPRLYSASDATVLEEFIPLTLADALAQKPAGQRSELIQSIGRTISLVSQAGFAPRTIHDWRSRGNDVVLIDYGSDLGSNIASDSPGTGHGMAAMASYLAETSGGTPFSEIEIAQLEYARRGVVC